MSLINTVTDKKQLYSLSQNSEGLTDHVGEDMVVVGVAQWETTRKSTGDECVCTGFVLEGGSCITTLSPTETVFCSPSTSWEYTRHFYYNRLERRWKIFCCERIFNQ